MWSFKNRGAFGSAGCAEQLHQKMRAANAARTNSPSQKYQQAKADGWCCQHTQLTSSHTYTYTHAIVFAVLPRSSAHIRRAHCNRRPIAQKKLNRSSHHPHFYKKPEQHWPAIQSCHAVSACHKRTSKNKRMQKHKQEQ